MSGDEFSNSELRAFLLGIKCFVFMLNKDDFYKKGKDFNFDSKSLLGSKSATYHIGRGFFVTIFQSCNLGDDGVRRPKCRIFVYPSKIESEDFRKVRNAFEFSLRGEVIL